MRSSNVQHSGCTSRNRSRRPSTGAVTSRSVLLRRARGDGAQPARVDPVKEFALQSGRRVDAINKQARMIVELKPNNPQAIARGLNQLGRYLDELNRGLPEGEAPWTGHLVTYG